MKKVPIVIAAVTLFTAFYQIAPHFGLPEKYTLIMFLLAPFLVLYMAYVILKYGTPSKYTFDDRFYEDMEEGAA